MNIVEIQETLHGELPFIGTPCLLIRLAGCNLHCPYCDTQFDKYQEKSVDSIAEIVRQTRLRNILITGGEPLLQQEEVIFLMNRDLRNIYVIETNGSLPIPDMTLGSRIRIVMDVKLTGERDSFHFLNIKRIRANDIVKFVFWDMESYEKSRDFFLTYQKDFSWQTHWVWSPTPEFLIRGKLFDIVNDITLMQKDTPLHKLSLQVQLHKILKIA